MKTKHLTNERFQLKPIAAAVLIGLSVTSGNAAPAPAGFQVDDTNNPVIDAGGKRIAMDGLGNAVVVWGTQAYYDPSPSVVFRRYDVNSLALSNAPTVASLTVDSGATPAPSVACNADGVFTVVWYSGSQVMAQRFASDATTNGTEIVVDQGSADDSSQSARVGIDSNGNFVVVWITGGDTLLGRLFDADGNALTDEITLSDQPLDNNSLADVAMDKDGNFAVTWLSAGQVYVRRFDANGTAAAAGFRVDSTPPNDDNFDPDNLTIDYTLSDPVIAMDETGDFAVAWRRDQVITKRYTKHTKSCYSYYGTKHCYTYNVQAYRATTKSTIRFRRYDSATSDLSPAETQVAKATSKATYDENDTDPNFKTQTALGSTGIAMDQDGDFAVAWVKSVTKRKQTCYTDDYGYKYCYPTDTTTSSVQARRFKSSGKPKGIASTIAKPTQTVSGNVSPSLALSQKGDLGVSWVEQVPYSYDGYSYGYTDTFWARLYPVKKK
ncbi:MAG TPA: hypothetical protein VL171_00400 [Verrucomicrobiae bacterium]|nr:hypothetical protein [Verrucomicrobiae bacterium]